MEIPIAAVAEAAAVNDQLSRKKYENVRTPVKTGVLIAFFYLRLASSAWAAAVMGAAVNAVALSRIDILLSASHYFASSYS
ncbi:MAG: hypothetical protein ABRQ26_03220 [Syntrophomonadaceae bacterium]